MTRPCRITLYILASIVLFLALAATAVCIILFNSSNLSSIVISQLNKQEKFEFSMGGADIVFFRTFPELSLHLTDFTMADKASADTLTVIPDLFAAVDAKAFLQDKSLLIRKVSINNVYADVNKILDAFPSNDDTSIDEEPSTEPFSLPFGLIDITAVDIDNLHVIYGKNAPGTLRAELHGLDLSLKLSTCGNKGKGTIMLELPKADISIGDTVLCRQLPLAADITFNADLDSMKVELQEASITIADQLIAIRGTAAMPASDQETPIDMDLKLSLGQWDIAQLIELIPTPFQHLTEGISAAGYITLDASAYGRYSSAEMPVVNGTIKIENISAQTDFLPVGVDAAEAELAFNADMDRNIANAKIISFSANSGKTSVAITGNVSDILEDPAFNLDISLSANIKELLTTFGDMLPDSLNLIAEGDAELNAKASGKLSDVTESNYDRLAAAANLKLQSLDVIYNENITVNSPELALALSFKDNAIRCDFDMSRIQASMDTIDIDISSPCGAVAILPSLEGEGQGRYLCSISGKDLYINMGSALSLDTDSLALEAAAERDSSANNILAQWSPELDLDFKGAFLRMSSMEDTIKIPSIRLAFADDSIRLYESSVAIGNSDFNLSGIISEISGFMYKSGLLTADMEFISSNADVDQLLSYVSGFGGSGTDTTEIEESEPMAVTSADTTVEEPAPFMVPLGVDVTLNTKIDQALAFGNKINNVGGEITIKDGTAIIRQLGFTSDAAKMQLTAMYKSPRKNHLFAGLDFHLVDIEIDKLIQMIPQVDSIVPMLKSFAGQAEFHLGFETYLNSKYELKKSTILGAATIEGRNLVVLDSETFDQIASLLMFKKSQKNVIDSLMVDVTVFRNEVDIYPFLLSIDNYQLVLSGRHNLDMSFNYHLECLSPIRLGVDVKGSLGDLKIGLSPTRYKDMFVPERRNDMQERTIQLMELINSSLKEGVNR